MADRDLEHEFASAPWVDAAPPRRRRWLVVAGGAAVAVLLAVAAVWAVTRPAAGQVVVTVSPEVVVSTARILVTVSPSGPAASAEVSSTAAPETSAAAAPAPATTQVVRVTTTAAARTTAAAAPATTAPVAVVGKPEITGFTCSRSGDSFSASASFVMHGAAGSATITIGSIATTKSMPANGLSMSAWATISPDPQPCSLTVTNTAGSASKSTTAS